MRHIYYPNATKMPTRGPLLQKEGIMEFSARASTGFVCVTAWLRRSVVFCERKTSDGKTMNGPPASFAFYELLQDSWKSTHYCIHTQKWNTTLFRITMVVGQGYF